MPQLVSTTPRLPAGPAIQKAGSRFSVFCPAVCFEDMSKSAEGKQRRIGGIGSTEAKDLQGEDMMQKGMNWDDALSVRGFFNNDHSKNFLDLLGAPERVEVYEPGTTLPDGQVAKSRTSWVEGYLFDTADGRRTWELAKALQGSGRQLGFSVEGQVEERTGPMGKTIAKARIQHIAITHQPVNQDCRLEVLLRSIQATNKALAVGQGVDPQDEPARSGRAMTREQLDDEVAELDLPTTAKRRKDLQKRRDRAKQAAKSLSWPATLTSIYQHLPDASVDYAVALGRALRRQSLQRS